MFLHQGFPLIPQVNAAMDGTFSTSVLGDHALVSWPGATAQTLASFKTYIGCLGFSVEDLHVYPTPNGHTCGHMVLGPSRSPSTPYWVGRHPKGIIVAYRDCVKMIDSTGASRELVVTNQELIIETGPSATAKGYAEVIMFRSGCEYAMAYLKAIVSFLEGSDPAVIRAMVIRHLSHVGGDVVPWESLLP